MNFNIPLPTIVEIFSLYQTKNQIEILYQWIEWIHFRDYSEYYLPYYLYINWSIYYTIYKNIYLELKKKLVYLWFPLKNKFIW